MHPKSDKTGFRGPFMIEKIPLAIGNYRFLPFKCVFGELQCIRPKVLAILGFDFRLDHCAKPVFFAREKEKRASDKSFSTHLSSSFL